MVKKRTRSASAYIQILLLMASLVVLNLMSGSFFFRLDLTKEKRYTLSPASKNLATKLDDVLFVKVYLEGEFPAGFKRLRNSIRELLDEYRFASGTKIDYEFIDPFEGKDNKQINDIIEQLGTQGLYPTSVKVNENDEQSQKLIVPGVVFFYKGKEYPLNLLKGQFGTGAEETINQSIELLEYNFSNVLRKCTLEKKKKIGFLVGHGELRSAEISDLGRELSDFYELARVSLDRTPPEKLQEYDGLVIAKADSAFSEYDKFAIDQYVMHGGKLIWLIDRLFADMDSTRNSSGEFMTYDYNLNLDDIPFRYGVRVNPVLVQDLQCNYIPMLTGYSGAQPQTKMVPWVFFPVLGSPVNHPIVKNLDPVWAQFCNTLDTVGNRNVKKTVLLQTSDYSREVSNPVRVNVNIARVNPNPAAFAGGSRPVAVLLEGSFESVFKNRRRMGSDSAVRQLDFKKDIAYNQMIVIADGDIARNFVSKAGEIYPLGYDRHSKQTFGNKNFMLNCVDYLCDNSGLIEVRMKEIRLRLLDRQRMKDEKLQWQLLNMGLPVLLILLFGLGNAYTRKKKYTR